MELSRLQLCPSGSHEHAWWPAKVHVAHLGRRRQVLLRLGWVSQELVPAGLQLLCKHAARQLAGGRQGVSQLAAGPQHAAHCALVESQQLADLEAQEQRRLRHQHALYSDLRAYIRSSFTPTACAPAEPSALLSGASLPLTAQKCTGSLRNTCCSLLQPTTSASASKGS